MEFFGFGEELLALAGVPERLALHEQRQLRGEALDQVALRERERGVGRHTHHEHADRSVIAHERHVEAFRAWKRVSETTGFLVVAPDPIGDA